jgi:hypothetical protein
MPTNVVSCGIRRGQRRPSTSRFKVILTRAIYQRRMATLFQRGPHLWGMPSVCVPNVGGAPPCPQEGEGRTLVHCWDEITSTATDVADVAPDVAQSTTPALLAAG